ncbi:MAG: PP2C family protein-serine/threonine phosphatase [Prochlorotrichaceae cyanobacterium]|jgi:sigma-B regulation protein RsbU (phosphoserine phosphatase)
MTSAPLSKSAFSSPAPITDEASPVLVLKELVAKLNREQTKTQDLLSSLGFALRSFTNLNQFLELVPLMASRVTDADGGALIIFRANGQMRLERIHCSDESSCHDLRRVLEESVQSLSLGQEQRGETAQLMRFLDDRLSQRLSPDIQIFGTAVLNKNLERGRLYVFSYSPGYVWTDARQKLVRLVADQTAVAIENDELTAELRQKERLDRELEIGAEIQRQLLPRHCPQIAGLEIAARCQTANRVGGDYYDFIPLYPDRFLNIPPGILRSPARTDHTSEPVRWGITIGDVMGKGVPAGLIMTMLRGMLRAEVLNGHTPAKILQHLNHVMYTDLENSNRFVTLFYSEYDPLTRILSYSNAAHNPPLLWQRETGRIHRLDALGMLIGLDAQSQYEDARVQLQPGDVVIYYTDGFTDAVNAEGDRYDEEKLIQLCHWACQHCDGARAILDFLFAQIQKFIGQDLQGDDRHYDDDMTLLVLQVESEE